LPTTSTQSSTPSMSSAAVFNSKTWYRLTNNYLGPSISLDIVNNAGSASDGTLQMAATGVYSGQFWQFRPASKDGSTYNLCTMFLGPNMRLDVLPSSSILPHLEPTSSSAGQIWSITAWRDGTWQLTNAYNGAGLHLDTYSDTHQPFMGNEDHTGQHWTISTIGPITNSSFAI
jgi:hypothetical protein